MLRKRAIVTLCLSLILGATQSASAVSGAGVLFLRIAAGARAAGMGEAFVAVADDAAATHWNPAGLGQYPLYSRWLEFEPADGRMISQAVVVRSVSLGGGEATYDVWAISEGKLIRFSGGRWETEVPLPPEVTEIYSLCAQNENLWLATDQGLFRNSLTGWKPVVAPTDDGWIVEKINDIHVTAGPRVWLATDDGVKVYNGRQWVRFGVESGLPSPKVLRVYFVNLRQGWAVTAAGLARLDGEIFDEAEQVTALIGETIPRLAARFIGTEDEVRIARAAEEIRQFNGLEGDEVAPGTILRIPYRLAFESEITCLTVDVLGRLWVGTEQGLKSFGGKKWKSFGYRAHTVVESMPLSAITEMYLGPRGTRTRTEAFTNWTARYNNLSPDETIQAGRTIYLYSSPAGGPIRSLLANGRKVYVGSKYGFLVYDDGRWGRVYQAGLDHVDGVAVALAGRDLWFFAPGKVVSHARGWSEVTFMLAKWLPNLAPDMYYGYFSLVTHMEGTGTIGANVTILSYGRVDRTEEGSPDVVGSFSPMDFSFGLSYGTRLTSNLAAGLTAKVIYSHLSDQGAGREMGSGTATAFGLDAGLLYRTPLSRLTLGAALTNLGPDITYIDADQSDPLPRNLALGLAYRLVDSPYNRLTLTGEINKDLVDWGGDASTEFKQIIYNLGIEYWYAGLVALRAGYIYDEDGDIKTPTVGGGLSLKGVRIDLAYIPSVREGQVMADIPRGSLTVRF